MPGLGLLMMEITPGIPHYNSSYTYRLPGYELWQPDNPPPPPCFQRPNPNRKYGSWKADFQLTHDLLEFRIWPQRVRNTYRLMYTKSNLPLLPHLWQLHSDRKSERCPPSPRVKRKLLSNQTTYFLVATFYFLHLSYCLSYSIIRTCRAIVVGSPSGWRGITM